MLVDRLGKRIPAIWPWLASLPFAAAQTIPPGYEIIQLTDTPAVEMMVSMNNVGQIVWADRTNRIDETMDIYLYDDATGAITRLTDDNVPDRNPDINDAGTVVWSRELGETPQGEPTAAIMMRLADGTVIQLTDGDQTFDLWPKINASHQVAWIRWDRGGPCGDSRNVLFFDGQTVRRITDNDWTNQSMDMNDHGDIVWGEFDFCGGPGNWNSRIKLYPNGEILTLNEPGFADQWATINNSRSCAWGYFHLATREEGIMTWSKGVRSVVTDGGEEAPVLNNHGDMSFIRQHPNFGWQFWMYRSGRFFELTKGPFWNVNGVINDLGECAWSTGHADDLEIAYLRRFSLGDMNCDGALDAFDIEPFILALIDPSGYGAEHPLCDRMLADLNNDDTVDAFDIEPLAALLAP